MLQHLSLSREFVTPRFSLCSFLLHVVEVLLAKLVGGILLTGLQKELVESPGWEVANDRR